MMFFTKPHSTVPLPLGNEYTPISARGATPRYFGDPLQAYPSCDFKYKQYNSYSTCMPLPPRHDDRTFLIAALAALLASLLVFWVILDVVVLSSSLAVVLMPLYRRLTPRTEIRWRQL